MNTKYSSDESLIIGFTKGSEACFETLVLRHQEQLFQFALYMSEDPEFAEDVVLETFFKVYREADSFIGVESVKALLFKAVLGYMMDRADDEVVGEFEERVPQFFKNLPEVALYEEFLEALFKLSPKYRLVFLLRDTFGFASADVEGMLNLSRDSLRRMIYRARLMMRRTLLLLGSSDISDDSNIHMLPAEIDESIRVLN